MKKFISYFQFGLRDALQHRFQLVYWMLLNLFPVLAFIYLWKAVYQTKAEIGGYSLAMMMTYYAFTRLLNRIITTYTEIEISREIKEGEMTKHLVRPMNYFIYKFGERLGIRIVTLLLNIPVYAAIFLIFREYFILEFHIGSSLLLLINVLLSVHLYFLISYAFGLMAFFMTETHSLFGMKDNIINLLAGAMFPLQLMPETAQHILTYLPFQYFYFFPMQIYFGKLSSTEILTGFSIQVLWIVIMSAIIQWMWKTGIRRYEAIGI